MHTGAQAKTDKISNRQKAIDRNSSAAAAIAAAIHFFPLVNTFYWLFWMHSKNPFDVEKFRNVYIYFFLLLILVAFCALSFS